MNEKKVEEKDCVDEHHWIPETQEWEHRFTYQGRQIGRSLFISLHYQQTTGPNQYQNHIDSWKAECLARVNGEINSE